MQRAVVVACRLQLWSPDDKRYGPRVTRAFVVSDLGWGDSGKGTTVDFLVRAHGARLVVRWNGGSQAGHRVVTDDGRTHVFAQIGAGSFVDDVRTHLAETVLVDPLALAVEARAFGGTVRDRMTIAESARIITPFHVAANHVRELARGDARHGTCGCGIGETVRDAIEDPTGAIRARDLVGDVAVLRRRLGDAQERLAAALDEELRAVGDAPRASHARAMLRVFDARGSDALASRITDLGGARVVEDGAIDAELARGDAVLEGAQGVLLDQDVGVTPPHVTWSRTTTHAASEWLDAHGFAGERVRYGVMRTYATRHGAGPMPTEAPALSPLLPEPAPHDGWQGAFRVGWLDLERLRYAIDRSPIDALVVTHLDRLAAIPAREGEPRDTEAFVRWIEAQLGRRVAIASHGPTAAAKRILER
jgi:adenylosuccinate synthase